MYESEVTHWKLERIKRKITQKELAEHLKINRSYISSYEAMRYPWDAEKISKYRKYIMVTNHAK